MNSSVLDDWTSAVIEAEPALTVADYLNGTIELMSPQYLLTFSIGSPQ